MKVGTKVVVKCYTKIPSYTPIKEIAKVGKVHTITGVYDCIKYKYKIDDNAMLLWAEDELVEIIK